MRSLIDNTIESVKRITAELKPGMLDILGLAAAVEWQAQEFMKRTNISCAVTIEPANLVVDADRATTIFRIFQEALTNIARHARAASVVASLVKVPGRIVLSVRDDGTGITEKQINDTVLLRPHGDPRTGPDDAGGEVSIRGTRSKGTESDGDHPHRHRPSGGQPPVQEAVTAAGPAAGRSAMIEILIVDDHSIVRAA